MAKQLLTGQEMRHNAKQRLQKHRETMAKQGFKTVSVFMSEDLRAELKRLGTDMDLTKYDALNHIFNIYLKTKDISQALTSKVEPIESIEDTKIMDKAIEPETIIKPVTSNGKELKQLNLFDPDKVEIDPEPDQIIDQGNELPDCHGQTLTTEERDTIVLKVAAMFNGRGCGQSRMDALNKAGVTKADGDTWTDKNQIKDAVFNAKKRQGKP